MRRWIMSAVVLAFPLVGAMTYAGTANAVATTGVTCTKLTGTVNLVKNVVKVTISGCNDSANTGGTGTQTSTANPIPTSGTITWKGKGTTTFDNEMTSEPGQGVCPKGDLEEVTTATVNGGTNPALKSIKVGWVSHSTVCYGNGKLTLAKGTKYTIAPATAG
jgi:hypothetical protein